LLPGLLGEVVVLIVQIKKFVKTIVWQQSPRWWQRNGIRRKCEMKHEWKTSPHLRTGVNKTNCPYCPKSGKESRPEAQLRQIFESLLGVKFFKFKPPFLKRMEFDGANEDLKLAFEYDG